MLCTSDAAIFERPDRLSESGSGTDTLIVGRVAPADFRALEAEREARGQRFVFFYLVESQMAIITI